MRVLIVVRSMEERVLLLAESMQHAMDWRYDNSTEALEYLRTNPNAVLVTTARLARQGFTVPPDTLILVGPEIGGADLLQIRARTRRADLAPRVRQLPAHATITDKDT